MNNQNKLLDRGRSTT